MSENFTLPEERRRAAYRALTDQEVNAPGPHLADLADSVLTQVDEIDLDQAYPEDQCAEIADSAVPVYTSELLETLNEDIGVACWEPECGPAYDGTPTVVNIAAAVLFELASSIASARLQERREEAAEQADYIEEARERGEEAAKSVATWILDGSRPEYQTEFAQKALQAMEDGDPRLDEYLPDRPNLSGEYADNPTPLSLAREITGEDDPELDLVDELAQAFEGGVDDAFEAACEVELRKAAEPADS